MTTISYYILTAVLAVTVAIGFAMKEGQPPLEPKTKRGIVRYVIDGDTLILRGQERHIRLWGVDAPEKAEKGFHAARNRLVSLSEGKWVTFQQQDTDHYGRIVARVFLKDGREINALMIESGKAKEYRRFSKGFYSR